MRVLVHKALVMMSAGLWLQNIQWLCGFMVGECIPAIAESRVWDECLCILEPLLFWKGETNTDFKADMPGIFRGE